jgi:hypothetical protein
MPRGNGGIIGPVNTSFSGVWSLTEAQLRRSANTWPNFYAALLSESATGSDVFSAADNADPYFEYTTLLLPGNGTNGAQNSTFLDSSTNNFTITRNGNTTQGTFSPFSQTGWGNYFDGTGDYLDIATNAAFDFGTSDFTIECWAYLTTSSNAFSAIISCFNVAGANPSWCLGFSNTTNQMAFFPSYFSPAVTFSYSSYYNTWTHIAVTRSGTSLRLFANGALVSSATDSTTVSTGSKSLRIGSRFQNDSNYLINGYLSNLRIVKGTAVYTSAFTPPTSPLTAISGTSLLTCQSNRFIDNSTNNFTITRNGDVSVQAFSPFNPTASWSAATYGGSGYFDGNGDYLQSANSTAFNLASNNFTIELWYYTASTGNQVLISAWNTTSFEIIYYAGTLYCQANATAPRLTTTTWPLNQWNHIAYVRSGNTHSAFLNGVRFATTTDSQSIPNVNAGPTVGARQDGTLPFSGYIASARIVNGTAVYDPTSSTLTVPTAPLTNITNTSLLLNFTNAGIYDATSKNDLETVGNAQISTAISAKWGSGSMYFDGNGDGLYRPNTDLLNLGTGNFTIEFWLNFSSKTGYQTIASFGYTPIASTGWLIQTGNGDGKAVFYSTTAPSTTTVIATDTGATVNTGQWYHVAIVRNAGTTTIYRDGTSVGSGSDSTNYSSSTAVFYTGGGSNTGFNNYYLNGYLQDVRITKGIARYTANFTAPTAAFPTL